MKKLIKKWFEKIFRPTASKIQAIRKKTINNIKQTIHTNLKRLRFGDAELEKQYNTWEDKKYELINFHWLIENKNYINCEWYSGIVDSIIKSNFKNVNTISHLLAANGVNFDDLDSKEQLITQITNDFPETIQGNCYDTFFEINKADLLSVVEEAELLDIRLGNIIIIYKPHFEEIINTKLLRMPTKKPKPEFRKVKITIGIVCAIVIIMLILLSVFSGQIERLFVILNNWFMDITNNSINFISTALLFNLIDALVKVLVVWIFYRLILLVIKITFKMLCRNNIRKRISLINEELTPLDSKFVKYNLVSKMIMKKNQSAMRGIIVFLRTVFIILVIMTLLTILNINLTTLYTSAGIITFITAVGAQTLLGDFFSGLVFAFEGYFNVGDYVMINNIQGRVISSNLRRVCIETFSKEHYFIKHSKIQEVINYSKDNNNAIVHFDIAYEMDADKVKKLLEAHLAKVWRHNTNVKEEPIVYCITEFNASGIGFMVGAECERETILSTQRWIRMEIFKLFRTHNIEIPYQKISLVKK